MSLATKPAAAASRSGSAVPPKMQHAPAPSSAAFAPRRDRAGDPAPVVKPRDDANEQRTPNATSSGQRCRAVPGRRDEEQARALGQPGENEERHDRGRIATRGCLSPLAAIAPGNRRTRARAQARTTRRPGCLPRWPIPLERAVTDVHASRAIHDVRGLRKTFSARSGRPSSSETQKRPKPTSANPASSSARARCRSRRPTP